MRFNGKKYQEIIQGKGLTPEAVCTRTGLHITSLNFILENGFASEEAMERLAAAAGAELGALIVPDITGTSENTIEFEKDCQRATVTFSQGRFKTRIRKLAEKRPEDCQIIAENQDGSLCAHIPVGWIRINPSVELSDAQVEARRRNILNVQRVLRENR